MIPYIAYMDPMGIETHGDLVTWGYPQGSQAQLLSLRRILGALQQHRMAHGPWGVATHLDADLPAGCPWGFSWTLLYNIYIYIYIIHNIYIYIYIYGLDFRYPGFVHHFILSQSICIHGLVACSTWKTFEKYRNIRISP